MLIIIQSAIRRMRTKSQRSMSNQSAALHSVFYAGEPRPNCRFRLLDSDCRLQIADSDSDCRFRFFTFQILGLTFRIQNLSRARKNTNLSLQSASESAICNLNRRCNLADRKRALSRPAFLHERLHTSPFNAELTP